MDVDLGPTAQLKVRLTPSARASLRQMARRRGTTMSAVLRELVIQSLAEPVAQEAPAQAGEALELQLHVLIAVEQVLALIESFLPEGPGAAARVQEEAALAAQRRLAGVVEGGQP
jgi:hypothetical protein